MASKITIEYLEDIIRKLEQKHVLAMPTDTIYGLVAKPSKTTINCIYALKKRNRKNKPLALIVSDFKMLLQVISISEWAKNMIINNPHTAITIISHGRVDHPLFNLIQHHGLIGARITHAVWLQKIIQKTGPLIATSVNLTGQAPCITELEVTKLWPLLSIISDQGVTMSQVPSPIYHDLKKKWIRKK